MAEITNRMDNKKPFLNSRQRKCMGFWLGHHDKGQAVTPQAIDDCVRMGLLTTTPKACETCKGCKSKTGCLCPTNHVSVTQLGESFTEKDLA